MIRNFKQFVNSRKTWLVLANAALVFFLIILNNLEIIPPRTGDFVFLAVLVLAFVLWRPRWAFWFFVGLIPLEIINLAPESLGIGVRPYQFVGVLLILAVLIRLISSHSCENRTPVSNQSVSTLDSRLRGNDKNKLFKFNLADWMVAATIVATIVTSMGVPISMKFSVILVSFALLYFLIRYFVRNLESIKKVIPFFLSSAVVISLYGIWQNISFLNGLNSFETMPGRPNGTFFEADWLGMFLVLLISSIYILFFYIQNSKLKNTKYYILNTICLALFFTVLILTVSRSAWLGTFAASFIFLFIILTRLKFRNWRWKVFFKNLIFIASAGIISLIIVQIFHLTNFQLGNRIQSTGTGLQKITIACETPGLSPEASGLSPITDISELEKYGCRHINLEDIEEEKAAGNYILEANRKDPNVNIRQEIYRTSWDEIKKHPIRGIGWGSIGEILGQDGNGNSLNSSNIFLETWLGAGIFGFLALVVIFVYILFKSIKSYFFAVDTGQKTFNLFVIISWFGLIIFNMFNAGIFLGTLWVWLAITNIQIGRNYE